MIEGASIFTPKTGVIGTCPTCLNKSELISFTPGSEPICEDCFEQKRQKKKVQAEGSVNRFIREESNQAPEGSPSNDKESSERQRYLTTIFTKANPEWHKKFVREVLRSRILEYDWQEILKSERYFSILDLRRLAAQLEENNNAGARTRSAGRGSKGRGSKGRSGRGKAGGRTAGLGKENTRRPADNVSENGKLVEVEHSAPAKRTSSSGKAKA